MSNILRSHTLYLTSKNREPNESPWQMSFDIPDGSIYLHDAVTESIKISLVSFNFASQWTEINDTNNAFRITKNGVQTNITIPSGNYPFAVLAKEITSLANGQFVCQWDMPSNRLMFSNATNTAMQLTFINQSWQMLGFTPSDNGITNAFLISTTPLQPRQNTELYVRLNNMTVGDGSTNYDNLEYNQLVPSTILSMIPISIAPFQHQFTDNTLYGNAVGVYVSNEKLNNISISITDRLGEYATWISDWTATLKVEVLMMHDNRLDELKAEIEELKDTMSKLLQYKVINNSYRRNIFG